MGDAVGTNLVLETEPEPEDVRLLEHQHRLPQRGL
jgi:hypothetical protein